MHVRAVVDPESQHDTGSDEKLVDTGQATADGTRSVLGNYDVGQYNVCDSTFGVSLLYKGVTMEAAPTPRPAMNLPTKIAAM